MENTVKRPLKAMQDPVDEWLEAEGYFRKHCPRDPTCLFRAVSEQVYLTQYYHLRVRKECVEFMRGMRHLFEEHVPIPFDCYLEQMACFTEWGTMNEIQAISLLYKRDVIIFDGKKRTQENVTNNNFKEKIYLCHTMQKQYESVYTKEHAMNAAMCQSIVYQIFYEDVFKVSDVRDVAHKMLHSRTMVFRHDRFFSKGNLEIREELATEIYDTLEGRKDKTDEVQVVKIPPFPYRVAKALDPSLYRNIDFDIWHEIRREVRSSGWIRNNELQVGGKCLIQMNLVDTESDRANNNTSVDENMKDSNGNEITMKKSGEDAVCLYGYIQEMTKDEGPVLVFIEELGEKRLVPYSSLKPLPSKKNKQVNWTPVHKKNTFMDSNQRWRKTCPPGSRKGKEPSDSSNTNDVTSSIEKKSNVSNNVDADNNENEDNNVKINRWTDANKPDRRRGKYSGRYPVEKAERYSVNGSAKVPMTVAFNNNTQVPVETVDDRYKENDPTLCNRNVTNGFEGRLSGSVPVENDMQIVPRSKPDGSYPLIQWIPGNVETSGERVNGTVSYGEPKNVDVNNNDPMFADPFSVRFFYNLGLEYYRTSHTYYNHPPNGQPLTWYTNTPVIAGPTTNTNDNAAFIGGPPAENEVNHFDQRATNYCAPLSENTAEDENRTPDNAPVNANSDVPRETVEISKPEWSRNDENGKDSFRAKPKEQHFKNRNISTFRPRKNGTFDDRYRKGPRQRFDNQHRYDSANQNAKRENIQPNSMQVAAQNSYVPYVPPAPVYTGIVPFYGGNEAESYQSPYFVPTTGCFPCLPHSETQDENVQSYPAVYTGVENYGHAYTGLCQPCVYFTACPNGMTQNAIQEQWYPPHSPYGQCPPVIQPIADAQPAPIVNDIQSRSS